MSTSFYTGLNRSLSAQRLSGLTVLSFPTPEDVIEKIQSHFYPPKLSQTVPFNYCYAVCYILKVDETVSSERMIPTNQIAWRQNPDDCNADTASGV
jgi:hypothetical protein